MLKIDNSLLVEIGLDSLPEAEKNSFLKHIYETLEMRVGIRLADQMTNEQLDEFERYFEAKDDAGAFKWLETNFPNYKDIVQEEFDKLKGEAARDAPQILLASQAAAANPQAAPQAYDAAPGVPEAVQPQQPAPQPAYAPQPAQPQAAPQPAYQQPVAQPQPAYQPPAPMQAPEQPQYQPPQPMQQQPVYQPPAPASQPTEQYQPPQPAAPQYPQQQPPAGPGQ